MSESTEKNPEYRKQPEFKWDLGGFEKRGFKMQIGLFMKDLAALASHSGPISIAGHGSAYKNRGLRNRSLLNSKGEQGG